MSKGRETETIGKGLIGKIGKIKKSLLSSMEESVVGVRELNKEFAIKAEKLKKLNKIFGDPGKNEAKIRSFAVQIAGEQKNKTEVLRILESIPGSESKLQTLLDRAAQEEFEKIGTPSLFRLAAAGIAGEQFGGSGGGVGAIIAQQALTSPPGLRGLIGVGRGAERIAERISPISPLLRGPVARQSGREIRRLLDRKEGGIR